MASREAMIDTIHRAYDARGKANLAGLMTAFHPDAMFEMKGDKNVLEVAGAVKGHSNVQAAMADFIDAFEFIRRDIIDTVVEGDRAVVHSRVEIKFNPKGVVVTTDVLDTFRFEDGKIIELTEFADTALIKSLISVSA
jgi:ketosteroid isomerase-like protein